MVGNYFSFPKTISCFSKPFHSFSKKKTRFSVLIWSLSLNSHACLKTIFIFISDQVRGFRSSPMDLENQWPKTIFRQFTLQKIRRDLLYILWNANYASPKNCPGCPRGPRSCSSQIDRVFCWLFDFFGFLDFALFFHDFVVLIKKSVQLIWIFAL